MSDGQNDYYSWLQDLTTRSVEEQTRAYQRYNDLVQRALRGEFNEPRLREDLLRFATEETSRYTREVAQLSVDYYVSLLELGRRSNERLYEQIVGGRRSSRDREPQRDGGPAAQGPPRQVSLELQGEVGAAATASFVIENKREEPAEISFQISDFVDLAGGAPFGAALQVQPTRLALGSRQEAEVILRLPLPADLFAPDHRYTARVVVRGYDELELILNVLVTRVALPTAAAAPEVEVKPKPPPPRKPRQTKATPARDKGKRTGSTRR